MPPLCRSAARHGGAHGVTVPLMEVLHAVFHRALVGAHLVVASVEQRPAPRIHALADLVVLDAGLHIGGLLGLDELALEGGDLLGVVELDHVERPRRADRVQRGHGEHVRVPLHHDVGVVGEPDRAALGHAALAVVQQHLVPLPVHIRAGLAEGGGHAHGLHGVVLLELPAQVVAGDEVAQPRVERAHVVVLQIDLDEGLPVVVALVQLDLVEHVAVERKLRERAHAGEVGGDVAAVVLEEEAVPLAQRIVVQVQAGIVREVRRAQQLPPGRVRPAVQRADDVARGMALAVRAQVAPALQHHRLAMAAHVGDQFDAALRVAHQGPALSFLRQRVIIARFGHAQLVPHIAGPALKDGVQLAPEQRIIEVA